MHLSQVSSKLSPITSYEGAVEGLVTHGFITGVEDIGCFVSFYNEVRGLVHKYAFVLLTPALETTIDSNVIPEFDYSKHCCFIWTSLFFLHLIHLNK